MIYIITAKAKLGTVSLLERLEYIHRNYNIFLYDDKGVLSVPLLMYTYTNTLIIKNETYEQLTISIHSDQISDAKNRLLAIKQFLHNWIDLVTFENI